MSTTFAIILPIFGLILCGYVLGRTPLFTKEGIASLGNFVFYLAIPALLFRTLGQAQIPDGIDYGILFAYFGACGVIGIGSARLARSQFGIRLDEQSMFGMATTFSNTVMIGIPLMATAFGGRGLIPLLLIVAVHSVLLMSVPMIVIEFARGERGALTKTLRTTALAMIKNPVIMSMVVGIGYRLVGTDLPVPIDRFIDLLGRAAPPCALFALGASLIEFKVAGNLAESLMATAFKLIGLPLLVWLLSVYVFELEPLWTVVATLTAALPTGANVFILAQKYDIYLQRAASTVVISTALSVVTLSILLAYYVDQLEMSSPS